VFASIATTLMVVIAFLVPLAVLVRQTAHDRALRSAEVLAQSLAGVLGVVGPPDVAQVLSGTVDPADGRRVSVVLPDGSTVGAPARADPADLVRARSGAAFSVQRGGGRAVYSPVRRADGSVFVVRVWLPAAQLSRGVLAAWAVLGALGLLLVGAAALVASRIARTAVRPVERLAAAARRLGSGDLSARVAEEGPTELREMARAFNRLADRIEVLLAEEREAVADLSHRLRTPLTALQLDVEQLPNPRAAARLPGEVDALVRAVDHLIREARRPAHARQPARVDLGDVARARAAFWGQLATEQDRSWSLDVAPGGHPVPLTGDEATAVVDALLGNIFAHTPRGVAYTVRVEPAAGGGSRLVVADRGIGFTDPDVLTRGVSRGGSTGLGLDIVRRSATVTGGHVRLGAGQDGGARVEVELGSRPPVGGAGGDDAAGRGGPGDPRAPGSDAGPTRPTGRARRRDREPVDTG
jgi:signal transduction histidine kinase